MLSELGIRRLAYDYRAEHVASFEEEIAMLQAYGIELTAWWFPNELNDEAKHILGLLEKHGLKTQLWVTGGGEVQDTEAARAAAVEFWVNRIRPIAEAANRIGCQVGLYNHGGWFGEPENQIKIIEQLRMPNVGIVYNLHHGHSQIDRLPQLLASMRSHLLAFNLNGMFTDGDQRGRKITPIGAGDRDEEWYRTLLDSGYQGPIGILNHSDCDARLRLLDNLDGLEWLKRKHQGEDVPMVNYRSWNADAGDLLDVTLSDRRSLPAAYDAATVESLRDIATKEGRADRGAAIFASAKTACLSCHRIDTFGGTVGPELTNIATKRSASELIASLLWPNHSVDEAYRVVQALTSEGELIRGYIVSTDQERIVVRDPASSQERSLPRSEIEAINEAPSMMPEGLCQAMSDDELVDLIAFVTDLGHHRRLPRELALVVMEHAQPHEPEMFAYVRDPLDPSQWPSWQAEINRDRLYDFYAKQASYFRQSERSPRLLQVFPGLDGEGFGHWGNQNEQSWADGSWNETKLDRVQCGVFQGPNGLVVRRGICVSLGDDSNFHVCFDPDTLTYPALWEGEFLRFSNVRHGLMHGVSPKGKWLDHEQGKLPEQPFRFQGFYRHNERVIFAYSIGEIEYLDSPWVQNGKLDRVVAPRVDHPLRHWCSGGQRQWPQNFTLPIHLGDQRPFATDQIELPWNNPWKSLIYCGDHAYDAEGNVFICTIQGDVWRGQGVVFDPSVSNPQVTWSRFASGLHHALGMVIDHRGIFVLGRNQITRLHDLNHDGEADWYECFSNAYETSPAGHDYICGLVTDEEGNFYTSSGNQGLVRISADGQRCEVIATGFRNPDGIGIYPDGSITVPCSEGEWTPTTQIALVKAKSLDLSNREPPFYGYRGPKDDGQVVEPPMIYLPRGIDNSSGGQAYIDSDRFGPLRGQMIHTSFGAASLFVLLRDEVNAQTQGAVYRIAGEFRSGIHRAKFHPIDGQLYVSGMTGWGTYSTDRGCLQRVRYKGTASPLPVGFHVYENGIAIQFSQSLQPEHVLQERAHFVQAWNYRYSSAYGSQEYSTMHDGIRGHDVLTIRSAHLLKDGRTLFLELPDLQPSNTVHLQLSTSSDSTIDLFATCLYLDHPFEDLPNYSRIEKRLLEIPLVRDLKRVSRKVQNPWSRVLPKARTIEIEAGTNLSFKQRQLVAKPGELLAVRFINPDVVPHNWVLVRPGKLQVVGEESNRMIGDPDAGIKHYVPQSDDIIAYTDIVETKEEMTIYFQVPDQPGRYPYLCTFPGHWMVMNGELLVRE